MRLPTSLKRYSTSKALGEEEIFFSGVAIGSYKNSTSNPNETLWVIKNDQINGNLKVEEGVGGGGGKD